MNSYTTRRFREAYAVLPEAVRWRARHAYKLFRQNPGHPSLQFKKVNDGNVYSVRVGLGYRALGVLEGSEIAWFWIGPHAEYERLI